MIAPATTSGRTQKRTSRARSDRSIVGHLVADAPDGDDGAGVADLAAQLAHVDVDRARVAGERVAPDALEQLVARQHHAAVLEQGPEEVELLGRELHVARCRPCTSRRPASMRISPCVSTPPARRPAARVARRRIDLTRATSSRGVERLGQVVVGADLEADDLVDVVVARRQHDDRHLRATRGRAADLEPVDVGQVEVEHDQVGRRRRWRGARRSRRRRRARPGTSPSPGRAGR